MINLCYEIDENVGRFYPSFLINDSIKWLILINPQDRFNSSIPSTSKTINQSHIIIIIIIIIIFKLQN